MKTPVITAIAVMLCLINVSKSEASFVLAKDSFKNPYLYIKLSESEGCRIHQEFALTLIALDQDGTVELKNQNGDVDPKPLKAEDAKEKSAYGTAPTGMNDLCLIDVTLKDGGPQLNLIL